MRPVVGWAIYSLHCYECREDFAAKVALFGWSHDERESAEKLAEETARAAAFTHVDVVHPVSEAEAKELRK